MADIFDRASEREMMNLDQALKAQRAKAEATPRRQGTGCCQNPACGEDFEGDMMRLFCGPKCAEEFTRYTGQN
ncbi:hypothetical protein [Microvirga alba]|uniref:Uncharacterized protein n=1 Tax=Microvirga alba TaxID=2791025 RepID=A0A931BZ99_9HYPH|nr:hypothetical protein [Microvirga alba]MBF9235547.1 hypothetical protein [Microvirga alba]